MAYHKFLPDASLQPFVECYFVWESEDVFNNEIIIESPPSGFCAIVFNFGSPYFLQNKRYQRLEVPKEFISGQSIYSYKLFLSGKIGIAGIVLKPAALATLFNLKAFELTEERANLSHVLSHDHVYRCITQIQQVHTPLQRVQFMETMLLRHVAIQRPSPDNIDSVANLIIEKNGMLNVAELLKGTHMSRRTFERRFFQKVGLSPKFYSRIRRIGYLCNLIAGKKQVNWADVFYEAEFYDQAHFIKDFEAFTGRTPRQYLRENTELANYVEKPRLQSSE